MHNISHKPCYMTVIHIIMGALTSTAAGREGSSLTTWDHGQLSAPHEHNGTNCLSCWTLGRRRLHRLYARVERMEGERLGIALSQLRHPAANVVEPGGNARDTRYAAHLLQLRSASIYAIISCRRVLTMTTRVRHRKQLTVTLSERTFAELEVICERENLRVGAAIEQAVRLRALELRIDLIAETCRRERKQVDNV